MKWVVGVTTTTMRLSDVFLRTLRSLGQGGFHVDRVFVDGAGGRTYTFHTTNRSSPIGAWGNWFLGLWELYITNPTADRYAMFQDDILCVKNLRSYLEAQEFPPRGYWNLITYPDNCRPKHEACQYSWYESNQYGRGAQGLVFSQDAVRTLLSQPQHLTKPLDSTRGKRFIDGTVSDCFRAIGWKEYVHFPSLLDHTGKVSVIGNHVQPDIGAFWGEAWDPCLEMPSLLPLKDLGLPRKLSPSGSENPAAVSNDKRSSTP